jgi:hypothetical protein
VFFCSFLVNQDAQMNESAISKPTALALQITVDENM